MHKLCTRLITEQIQLEKYHMMKSGIRHISIHPKHLNRKIGTGENKKRQDDIIRFIRHYEEKQLNPMIRATNSIALRFDAIDKISETLILSQLEANQERQTSILKKLSEQFCNHADVINNQSKQINALYQIHQRDYKKLLYLIRLYSELSACGVMDSKRKENIKVKICNLINT